MRKGPCILCGRAIHVLEGNAMVCAGSQDYACCGMPDRVHPRWFAVAGALIVLMAWWVSHILQNMKAIECVCPESAPYEVNDAPRAGD